MLFWIDFLAVCGIFEYGDVMWEQNARHLLKAIYIEEKLNVKKKCDCKLTLYSSNLPSCAC